MNPQRDPPIKEIKPNGMVIGVDKAGKMFAAALQEEEIRLQRGDLFFQYTDGLAEAPNREKAEFGLERVRQLLLENYIMPVAELVDLLEESVLSHMGTSEQEDDITMIAFRLQ